MTGDEVAHLLLDGFLVSVLLAVRSVGRGRLRLRIPGRVVSHGVPPLTMLTLSREESDGRTHTVTCRCPRTQ